jgi:hypothetical protein
MNTNRLKISAFLQIAFGVLLVIFSAALLFEYHSLSNVQGIQNALATYVQTVTDAKRLVTTTLQAGQTIADEVPKNLDDFAQAADDTANWIGYVPVPTKKAEQALHGSATTLRKTAKSIRTDLRPELDVFERSFGPSCDSTIAMLKSAQISAASGNRIMWLIGMANFCGGIVVILNGFSFLGFTRMGGETT